MNDEKEYIKLKVPYLRIQQQPLVGHEVTGVTPLLEYSQTILCLYSSTALRAAIKATQVVLE